MARKHNPGDIEEILASKEIETAKPQFTRSEWAVMTREYKDSVDRRQKDAVSDFTNNILKPWLEAIDQARRLREAGKAELVEEVTEAIRARTERNLMAPQDISGELLAQPRILPKGCIGTWILEPPYDQGFPTPAGEEQTTDTEATSGGPGIFKATSELTKPNEGVLSVGVGVGRFFDLYPAPLEDRFGDGNEVEANICHFMMLPSPINNPTRVDVAVPVTIDSPFAHTYHDSTRGTSGTATIEDGPVWALGNMYLTLFGSPTVGDFQRTTVKRFFVQMWTDALGCFFCDYQNNFDLSESLVLAEGAAGLGIIVEVRVRAFLTGRLEDLTSGFMGADFRLPFETHGIWLLETGGGPIRVPRMSVTFCRV